MLALGGQRLTVTDYGKLEKLLERTKKATTKRNKLTHGTWRINITIHKDKPNSATWERFYEPTDPRLYARIAGPKMNQKVRDDHIFPVHRIDQIAEETYNLSLELKAFTQTTTIVPFAEPQPIKLSSQQA
jgi:hypothetical protein